MWVAQITEQLDGASQGLHNELYQILEQRFPEYNFSVMLGSKPVLIARPISQTVMHPEDEANENEMLRHIVTELLLDIHGTQS